MFINPKIAIEKGWITHPEAKTLDEWQQKKFISPNAIDFTLDHLYEINHNTSFIISTDQNTGKELKQMRGSIKIEPVSDRATGIKFYTLYGKSYDMTSDMYVTLPEGVAALTIIRSTFNRNGIFLTSGCFDTGFSGNVGAVLHHMIERTNAKIEQGIRIGQIIFIESSNAEMYTGSYSHKQGEELQYRTESHGPK